MKKLGVTFCLLMITYCSSMAQSMFFTQEATNWNEAFPIGNGRLGGMVFGGVTKEKIQTNDDTFWSGEPRDYQKAGTYQKVDKIRELLYNDNTSDAMKMIDSTMLGTNNESYLPLADINLTFSSNSQVSNYKRTLDLSTGVVTITYTQDGINFKREIFASYPDQAIVIRLTADKEKAINLTATLSSLVHYSTSANRNSLVIKGNAPSRVEPNYTGNKNFQYKDNHGTRFQGRLLFKETDGVLTASGNTLKLSDAKNATISFVAATSFNGFDKDPYQSGKNEDSICAKYESNIDSKKYDELYLAHVSDYQKLFNRVSIDLGTDNNASLPINKRIADYNDDKDPELTSLYFQFGRYILISSSRPGSQPANLQGIWNNQIQPAWSGNWTLNCNAEINYWPVESTNLSECHLPLIQMAHEISVDGAKTAKNLYNARGWMAHHNIDLWRTTWPVGGTGNWAIYQVGGAWLCQHVWDHYLFSGDKAFLADNYQLLHDACLFYIDNMRTDKNGFLVTNPSISFENYYKKPDGTTGWACMGSAQDMQIIRALFKNTMKTIEILNNDSDFLKTLKTEYVKLAPMKISPSTGQLQEWNDDWAAKTPSNGQVAQGWGLVESNLITLRGTPELARAFRKTIEYRKPWLADNTGSWTAAFPANFWARLGEGNGVQTVINRHFLNALYPNLTCKFHNSWQVDGNLGVTSAIAEMLMQSQNNEIDILPALPSKYLSGYVHGLRARGGYTVDIDWECGRPISCKITSDFDNDSCKVYNPQIQSSTVLNQKGIKVATVKTAKNQISFHAQKGSEYTITFFGADIKPYVSVNGGNEFLTSNVQLISGDTLNITPRTSLIDGVWTWTGPNQYVSTRKDLVIQGIKAVDSGTYTLTFSCGNDTATMKMNICVKSKLEETKNSLSEGEYYIKKRGSDLYWTNIAQNKSTVAGYPRFLDYGEGTLDNSQLWIVTRDNGRYKIVSKADGRYVNEGGEFGKNVYDNTWNTMNIYNDSSSVAIQIAAKGAAAKGGTYFWHLNSNNHVAYSSNTTIDESKDLLFEFLKGTSTSIKPVAACNDVVITRYFTIDGRQINKPSRGISLLKKTMSNGMTRTEKIAM